jgi:hypothetical protein
VLFVPPLAARESRSATPRRFCLRLDDHEIKTCSIARVSCHGGALYTIPGLAVAALQILDDRSAILAFRQRRWRLTRSRRLCTVQIHGAVAWNRPPSVPRPSPLWSIASISHRMDFASRSNCHVNLPRLQPVRVTQHSYGALHYDADQTTGRRAATRNHRGEAQKEDPADG